MRIDRLQSTYQIDVKIIQFPLHPETPEDGLTLEELFAGRNVDLGEMKARMATLMANEGLPYGDRRMTFNSRLAQELAKWAEPQPNGKKIHDAVFRAYFVDGLNIARIDNLVHMSDQIGLSAREAREALTSRRFKDAVDADWARCRDLRITGVPAFVAGTQGVTGAQPYEVLEGLVVNEGAVKR